MSTSLDSLGNRKEISSEYLKELINESLPPLGTFGSHVNTQLAYQAQMAIIGMDLDFDITMVSIPDFGYVNYKYSPRTHRGFQDFGDRDYANLTPPGEFNYIVVDSFVWNMSEERFDKSIEFHDIIFNSDIKVSNSASEKYILFHRCRFLGRVEFSSISRKNIRLVNCTFDNLIFENVFAEDISILSCRAEFVAFNNNHLTNTIPILPIELFKLSGQIKTANFNQGKIAKLEINGINNNESIKLDAEISEITIRKDKEVKLSPLGVVTLTIHEEIPLKFLLLNHSVTNLSIKGINNRSIKVKDIEFIGLLKLEEFLNSNECTFENIELLKGLEFIQSSLGKTQFYNVNFDDNTKGIISQTNISDILITQTDFPETLTANA